MKPHMKRKAFHKEFHSQFHRYFTRRYEASCRTPVMERIHTYKSIAQSVGRDKRSAQNWLTKHEQETGETIGKIVNGVRMFSDIERETLLKYASPVKEVETETPCTPEISIEMGNHRSEIALSAPSRFSLEKFRSDRTRNALSNPIQFADSIAAAADELEDAMDEAEEFQELELKQIRSVKSAVGKKLDQIKARAERYRIKSDLISMIQNQEVEEIEAIAAEINDMGKSE